MENTQAVQRSLGAASPSDTFWTLVGTMMRRKKWIIGSIIFCGSLALLVSFTMKPVYSATAVIELNKSGTGSIGLDFGNLGGSSMGLGGGDLGTDLRTETAVLKSDSMAISVIRELNLASHDPFIKPKHAPFKPNSMGEFSPSDRNWLVNQFESNLKVSSLEGTRLIHVTYFSRDPKQAADIANGIIESYRNQYLQSHYAAVSQASDWMTQQLTALKSNVENSERQLIDFERSSGILALPTDSTGNGQGEVGGQVHSVVVQKLDMLNSELTAAETDRLQKEAIYRLTQTGNPDVIIGLRTSSLGQGISGAGLGGDIASLEQLQLKQSDLKLNMAQALAVYGPNNRHLKDLETQENVLNNQVREETQNIVRNAAAGLQVAEETENALRARFNEQQNKAAKLNQKNVQLAVLSQEAFSRKKLYEDLYTKLQEADVSAGIKATNISVVDPASPAAVPVRPRKALYLEFGLLLGAFFGLGSAFLMENVDKRVVRTSEIEEITGAPVIGVIPRFHHSSSSLNRLQKRKDRALAKTGPNDSSSNKSSSWIIAYPSSPVSESIRALRTSILLSRPGAAPKSILVTSSVPAEGKSTITSNLAIALAQNGHKVIIVEADLRRPTMKHILAVGNERGLSTVLSGTASLDQVILRGVSTANLDVLPAGPKPPMPSELLGSATFDGLLNELRAKYDIILIDSPPALILSDAVTVGAKVDAVLWVVRAGSATRPYLIRAAQLIRRGRLAFIGFVLNGVDQKDDPYGYGYGYGYGSEYGDYYGADDASNS